MVDPKFDPKFAAALELLEKQRALLLDVDKYNNKSGGQATINSNRDKQFRV